MVRSRGRPEGSTDVNSVVLIGLLADDDWLEDRDSPLLRLPTLHCARVIHDSRPFDARSYPFGGIPGEPDRQRVPLADPRGLLPDAGSAPPRLLEIEGRVRTLFTRGCIIGWEVRGVEVVGVAAPSIPTLRAQHASGPGWAPAHRTLTLGSGPDVDWRLSDVYVSEPAEGGVDIDATGSTNGIGLDGGRVDRAVVAFGGTFWVGQTRVDVVRGTPPGASGPPRPSP